MTDKSAGHELPGLSQLYLNGRESEGAVGFDGMGPIDYDRSDLVRPIADWSRGLPVWHEAILDHNVAAPRIFLRRAIRQFLLLYTCEFNIILVSDKIMSIYGDWIEPCSQGMTRVKCHFGTRSCPYWFGNLKYYNALKHCIWHLSRFSTVPNSDWCINQTKIGRGQVPKNNEVLAVTSNRVFHDEKECITSHPSLHKNVPDKLGFPFPPCDLINIGIAETLVSQRLYDALISAKRPKTSVVGMIASYPLVEVKFGA